MIDKLEKVYSRDDAKKALSSIEVLIEKYRDIIDSKPYRITYKDTVLITYADQVTDGIDRPLVTLKKFLDKFAKDIFSTIHILPFYPYSSDDGFSVIDYREVEPNFGTWSDIELLSRDYRLMFDAVINHISQHSSWFKGFLENQKEYKDFFIEVDLDDDISKVVRPRTLPLVHEFKDINEDSRYIWTTFSKDQVDLNFANYKVLIEILDVLLFYIKSGATMLRLDAVAFLYKKVGTSCIHLEETHKIIEIIREVISSVAPEVLLITETNVPHIENISYFGDGKSEADMVYNFALPPLVAHSILKGSAKAITKWAQELSLPSQEVCFFNFTASHDGCGVRAVNTLIEDSEVDDLVKSVQDHGGFISYRSIDGGKKSPYELNASYIDIISDPNDSVDLRVKKMILSQAISLAMPGVCGIYFHSFIGSVSDTDSVERGRGLRSINREKLDFNSIEKELSDDTTLKAKIYNRFKKLIFLRTSNIAFDPYGEFEFLDLAEELFTICRKTEHREDEILAIFNLSNREVEFLIPEFVLDGAVDIIENKKIKRGVDTISPYQVKWIKYKRREND